MLCDACCENIDNVAPVPDGSGIYSLVQRDSDWNLGNIRLSRSADVQASIRVHFWFLEAMS